VIKKLSLAFLGLMTALTFCYMYKPFQKKPFLTVAGFVKMADGLGRQCPDMIEALKDDFEIGFLPLAKSCLDDVYPSILPLIKNKNKKLGTVVFLNDCPWRPSNKAKPYGALRVFDTPKNQDQIRMCYTMLESTKIPKQWVEVLNTYFDLVAVPDRFLEQVFLESGVNIPVFTLPLGLDLKQYLAAPLKTAYNPIFRFGTMGSLSDRKNQTKLVMAFDQAFNKDPQVELLIHARFGDFEYKQVFLSLLEELQNPMIRFQETALDKSSYFELFKSLDMLVNVSKGEGFSIQPREAMALGIPCLLTDNTAQSSIVKEAHVVSLPTPLKKPCYYSYLKSYSGQNFDFEVEELKNRLKDAYAQRHELLAYSEKNREYASFYEYQKVKNLYRNLISPQKVKISHQNVITSEGLETNSLELAKKFQTLTGSKL